MTRTSTVCACICSSSCFEVLWTTSLSKKLKYSVMVFSVKQFLEYTGALVYRSSYVYLAFALIHSYLQRQNFTW